MTFNKNFDDLVRSIYLVSSGLEKIDHFLDHASAVFNSHLVGCIKTDKFDRSTQMPFFKNVSEKDKELYNNYFADKNVLITASLRELLGGQVVSSEENFTLAELHRTEFYDGYMRYLDAQYTAGFMFASTPDHFYTLVVARPNSKGAYTKQEKRMLGALRTHARSAMQINSHLNSLKSAVKISSHALDRLNMGICTIGRGLKILDANEAARDIFRDGIYLTTKLGQLAGGHVSDLKLAALLHKLSLGTIKSSQQARLFSGIPGEECSLSIFPVLDSDEFWWVESGQVRYIIFIGTQLKPNQSSLDFLEKEFALTTRELEVLSLLVQGGTLTSTAHELHVSHETIRSHTKNIFRKMEVHSQAQLAVKVLSLSSIY